MGTAFALKRLDDLMDELKALRRNIAQDAGNTELHGVWGGVSVDEDLFDAAEDDLFETGA